MVERNPDYVGAYWVFRDSNGKPIATTDNPDLVARLLLAGIVLDLVSNPI
jgi:hypothetical protein